MMRNLLLLTTLAMMLISQALAPRLVAAMPVSQQMFAQSHTQEAHANMACCQGKMDCKHCNSAADNCGQVGNCANHCSNLISVITPITALQSQPMLAQEISCPTWSVQTATVGVQTPPPNYL
ncbi:hypothetical protein KDN34_15425 [Shewanella yunxiaonensis]|uniref:Uncharacterized protein n=1 Tax=Shewanella yunxiaonensis TaxID=2829809 RepID=A0ABX7YS13_9GAMM|nr:hypothetical protein [Shewanella yunxiaonensis]QUN05559.1 hypothetical protein KDN34_15425 [Shewanella yunxiaonensis]